MALTERYVSASGGGLHDGTSEANAFTPGEMITDINTPRVGYVYNIIQDSYANFGADATITGDGTTTSPNILRGYKITIGDGVQGRNSDGTLNVDNMPMFTFDATKQLAASGANYIIFEALVLVGNVSDSVLDAAGLGAVVYQCHVTNNSTNASAVAIQASGSSGRAIDCDAFIPNGVAGAEAIWVGVNGLCLGCRAKSAAGEGIRGASACRIIGNTVYECGIGIACTLGASGYQLIGNTAVNCTGDGIDVAAGTGTVVAVNNHVTGNGGYGIDLNGTARMSVLANNRFRDNTSGNVNGGNDWTAATQWNSVTSDDADADDFVDASTDDYSLVAGAPATSGGVGFLIDIGAHGSPVIAGGRMSGNASGGLQC